LINTIMKLKILFFIFLAGNFPLFFLLHAQEILSVETNMFRANDTIVKQQVEYKNPGKTGENVFWNFGKLKPVDEKYTVSYSLVSDTTAAIAGTEHQTRYYYELRNDSLLLCGYENPTTQVTYRMPEILLRFPMRYGNKTEGYYSGDGTYCDKLDVEAYGSSKSLADATGVLILPNGDTLRHVTRVRTIKLVSEKILPLSPDRLSAKNKKLPFSTDSIQRHLDTDSVVLMTDTYRWYAAGYRYPVFETVRTGNYRDKGKTTYFTTAFFYPPTKHSYVATDIKNKSVQDELRKADLAAAGNNGNNNASNINATQQKEADNARDEIEFTYNIYPNPVESQLSFEFFIDKDATVSYELYTITGSLIYQQRPRKLHSGAYDDQIDMSRLIRGTYILRMQVNEKVYSEKIIKK
jgi:hypothetical protein